MTIKEAMSQAEMLSGISDESLRVLESSASFKTIKKGSHIFRDKDIVSILYIVASGQVTLYKMNNEGERKVIFILGSGRCLNEEVFYHMPVSINAEVLEDALCLCLPRAAIEAQMRNDCLLSKAVIDSMAHKIRRLYRQLKNTTGAIRADKRIAAKLWKLAYDNGIPCNKGVQINLDLSITYLADMLGMKRETVSRQLKVLTEAKVLIMEKGRFIVPDLDNLVLYFKTS